MTFIATQFPAYVVDSGLSPGLGATALALIGLFNIIGSFFWGIVGGKYSKKYSLSSLCLPRVQSFRPGFRFRNGFVVVGNGATDQLLDQADLRSSIPLDAVRNRIFQPSDRRLSGRLDGRLHF